MIQKIARRLALLYSGFFAGFMITVLVVELSLRRYDASVYTQVRQVELVRLDTLAAVTLLPAIVMVAILLTGAIRQRTPASQLTTAALVLLLVVFVTTLAVNLPINRDQVNWLVESPPADWQDIRDRWQLAHAIRTLAAVVAYALIIVVTTRDRRPAPPIAEFSSRATSSA